MLYSMFQLLLFHAHIFFLRFTCKQFSFIFSEKTAGIKKKISPRGSSFQDPWKDQKLQQYSVSTIYLWKKGETFVY